MRPPRAALATLTALSLAALSACETRATQEPCPGAIQGTFRVVGELAEGAACADAGGAAPALDLTVAVSFVDDGTAAVCLQRVLAEPLVGTRTGDSFEVAAAARSATSIGCACAVGVVERMSGTLTRGASGAVTGFAGELSAAFAPSSGDATCAANGAAASCAVPCAVRWTLTAG